MLRPVECSLCMLLLLSVHTVIVRCTLCACLRADVSIVRWWTTECLVMIKGVYSMLRPCCCLCGGFCMQCNLNAALNQLVTTRQVFVCYQVEPIFQPGGR
jgi:hypothetical protein